MSEVMLYGVLEMPYEMAMSDELSRLQYHQRGVQAAAELRRLHETVAQQRRTIESLNDAIGGDGSLTTDNLVTVSRLEDRIDALEQAGRMALGHLINLQPIIANGLLNKHQLAFIDPHMDMATDALRQALGEDA